MWPQVVLYRLLLHWGDDGLAKQVAKAQTEYKRRARVMAQACEAHLTGVAEWALPTAGMFLFVRVTATRRSTLPNDGEQQPLDTHALMPQFVAAKVLVAPGMWFHPRREPNNRLRLSFSSEHNDDIEEAVLRVARVLRSAAAVPIAGPGTKPRIQ